MKSNQEASESGCLAQVRAVQGTWVELWFPETGEAMWVDLAEIEYAQADPAPADQASSDPAVRTAG